MSTASSRRPAAMPEFSGFPSWVLLDTMVQLGRCENETTAHSRTRSGSPIEVTLAQVADPPGLSRCVVHCPGLTGIRSSVTPPAIVVGADGAFLLICVFFLPTLDGDMHFSDVFVYRAGGSTPPSLLLVPEPYPVGLLSSDVAVLSCCHDGAGEHCLVVVPERRVGADGRLWYDLQVFSTETNSWSTKAAPMARDSLVHYGEFVPDKAFAIGEDSLAWVDLQFGILMCENLHKDPEMRLIGLPALMPANTEIYGVDSDGCSPPLDLIRDVTYSNGWFRFVELEFLDGSTTSSQSAGWRATICKRKLGSDNWEWCSAVNSDEIFDKDNKPNLNMVSYPTLDMHSDDVVFMIFKQKASDPDGWVVAVNTESKKLEKMARFCAGSPLLVIVRLSAVVTADLDML
ncbi:hypothetical protein EJB05_52330, partial [Eragrostis curvula]